MFIRNQTKFNHKQNSSVSICNISILAIVILLGFFANLVSADANVSPREIRDKYEEIKAIYKRCANKDAPEELEGLVRKSTDFVDAFPEYKRVDQVHYYLGYALVQLGRVEEGIAVFEKFIKEHPEKRWVSPSLYELGLAYDKLGQHDKADESYHKLIEHPKYSSGSYARQAKKMLEQDRTSRKGRLHKPPVASSNPSEWIGKTAPDFRLRI